MTATAFAGLLWQASARAALSIVRGGYSKLGAHERIL